MRKIALMMILACSLILSFSAMNSSADDNWAALTPELPYTYDSVTYTDVIAIPYYVYPEFWTSFWYFNDSRENIPFSPSVSNFSIAWPYVVFRCQNSNPTNCTEPYLETSSSACLMLDPQFCFNTNDIKSSLDVVSIANYDFGSSHCNLGNVTANQVVHDADLSAPQSFSFPLSGSLENRTILLGFGDNWIASCGGQVMKHTGIDIAADEYEAVYAAEAGTVKVAQTDEDYGGWVTLEHDNGSYTTVYWHIIPTVSANDTVEKGDPIGEVTDYGATVHLHFGLRTSAYSNTSNRGRLPQSICGGDPAYPENFVDPETLSFE